MTDAKTCAGRICLAADGSSLVQGDVVIRHRRVHLARLGVVECILGRGTFTTVGQHHPIESCRGIFREGVDMHVTLIMRPVGPRLALLRAEVTTFATGIEVESASAVDSGREITVACHLHINSVRGRKRDALTVGFVAVRGVVATGVDGALFG